MDRNLSSPQNGEQLNTTEIDIWTAGVHEESDPRPAGCNRDVVIDARRNKRRNKAIHSALETNHALSWTAQEKLLETHFSKGWAKLPHGMSRHFRSPGRYGLKLVDIAVLFAIYDRTMAQIKPVALAAITADEFEDETGMDESNIRKALKGLLAKGALVRIEAGPSIIFWAINPFYFVIREKGEATQGDLPQGKPPGGSSPRGKNGNSPRVMPGQTTKGQCSQSSENQTEFSDAKNLLKESKKESSSCHGDFPEDMAKRWSRFKEFGQESNTRREKEIFETLFLKHGGTFFSFCGRVVEYVEQNVKSGGKAIQCPMSWIQNHWEINLTAYRNWKTKQDDLDRAHAEKLEKEARERAVQAEKQRQEEIEQRDDKAWKEEQDAAALRFLSKYSSMEDIQAFADEAIGLVGCQYTRNSWVKKGWDGSLARSCILEHFTKVERGERNTNVIPNRAAIA